jgi:CHAD domain-containing protein
MPRPRAAEASDSAAIAEGSRQVLAALGNQQARLKATAARLHAARAEDVHDARVAARRLRSLLATYRPLLDERRSRRLRRRLRDFARALTEVREADVRRDMVLALAKLEPPLAAQDTGRLRAALGDACAESKRSLRHELATSAWAASVERLGDERTLGALRLRRDAALRDVLDLVDRPWQRATKLLARPARGAATLHRLRLALKRCRYALESVSGLRAEQAELALGRLRSAQDSLGEHRDAAQARKWLRANEGRLGPALARRVDRKLRRHEKAVKAEAVARAAKVLPAYAAWRKAARQVRELPETSRGPARPAPSRRSWAQSES